MKPKIIALLVTAIAAVVTQPASAIMHQLVITENSSTSLSATLDGQDITGAGFIISLGPDGWLIGSDFIDFNAPIQRFSWVEPENPSLGNAVSFGEDQFGNPVVNEAFIVSDASTNFTPVANGSAVNNVGLEFIDFQTGFVPFSVVFIDNGDTAAAPDTGSTFGLFLLSLTGLLGANYLRSLRLA